MLVIYLGAEFLDCRICLSSTLYVGSDQFTLPLAMNKCSSFPQPYLYSALLIFVTWAILMSLHLIVFLVCIFLTTNETENLFICYLVIWVFSSGKCQFMFLALFLLNYLTSFHRYLVFFSYILDRSPLIVYICCNNFLPFCVS